MTSRIWLRLAETLLPVVLAIIILSAWEADRRDRAQLATQLAAAQQTIAEAASHQKDRDAVLTQTLTQIAELKQSAVTPAQILKALPQALALPAPITLQPSPSPFPGEEAARFSASPGDAHAAKSPGEFNLPNNPAPK